MNLPRLIGPLVLSPVIAAASHAAESPPLLDALNSDNRQERVDGLHVIAARAPDSETVLRQVIPHLGAAGSEERDAALAVFERLGPQARDLLPELVALGIETRLQQRLSEVDAAIRAVAGRTRWFLIVREMEDYCRASSGNDPSPLDEPQLASLKLPDWIGKRPPPREDIELFDVRLELLLADLAHENPDVRWTALRGLELALDPEEYTQLTALSALDPDPRVRSRVMEGLWRAGEDGRRAAALAYAIFHRLSGAHIRDQLARGSGDDVLFMQIAEVFAGVPNRTVWFGLSRYYGTFDKPAPRHVRFLTEALGEADPVIRFAAERTLARRHWWYQGVVQIVRDWLEDPDPETRAGGLRAARHLGDRVRPFVPRLTELATGSESEVERCLALRCLSYEPAPFANLVRSVQARMLSDVSDAERAECIRTLGAWGEAAAPAIPALFEFINDRSIRHDVVDALRLIHSADDPQQALLDRIEAGFQLQELSESLGEIVHEQKLLRDATREIQIRKLEALGEEAR
jgi:hypothetical protein